MQVRSKKLNPDQGILELKLRLSQRDIDVILALLVRVGGHPDGPRGVVQKITDELTPHQDKSYTSKCIKDYYYPCTWEEFETYEEKF